MKMEGLVRKKLGEPELGNELLRKYRTALTSDHDDQFLKHDSQQTPAEEAHVRSYPPTSETPASRTETLL